MKKASIIFLLLAWMPSVLAVNPWIDTRYPRKEVTLDGLYEACSVVGETARGDIPYFDCESYVYGVLDSYLAVRDSIPKENRACFPATLAPWEALKIAESADHLDRKPYMGTKTAGPVIIEMLRKKYPCK
jgi:hypothetical protein